MAPSTASVQHHRHHDCVNAPSPGPAPIRSGPEQGRGVSRTLTRVAAVAVVLVRGREVRMTGRLEIDADGEMHKDWTRQH